MKIILKNSITCSEEVINTLSERFILGAMDHPFIVKLHYASSLKASSTSSAT